MLISFLLIIAFIFVWAGIVGARAVGLVDHPDARKQHTGAIPLVGGIAIFFTLTTAHLLLSVPFYGAMSLVILTAVFLLGIYDDARHINASFRLVLHFVAGAGMAWLGSIAIHNVGNLLGLGNIPLLFMTIPLTALSFAGLSNACNMIDGIDGLSASLVGLPLLVLFWLATMAAHPMAPTLLPVLAAIAVFLLFNLGPNTRWMPKIFLGDAGSVTLGFLLTAGLVYFSQGRDAVIQPVTALWLVTVPLMDMLATMLKRAKDRRPVMDADRSHLHYLLIDLGLSARLTLFLLVCYASLCAWIGLQLEGIPAYFSLLIYFLLFMGHCLLVLAAGRSVRTRNPGGHSTSAR